MASGELATAAAEVIAGGVELQSSYARPALSVADVTNTAVGGDFEEVQATAVAPGKRPWSAGHVGNARSAGSARKRPQWAGAVSSVSAGRPEPDAGAVALDGEAGDEADVLLTVTAKLSIGGILMQQGQSAMEAARQMAGASGQTGERSLSQETPADRNISRKHCQPSRRQYQPAQHASVRTPAGANVCKTGRCCLGRDSSTTPRRPS